MPSVSNGQRANEDTFNNAFISKQSGGDTTGVIGLNNVSSGGLIANAQQKINDNTTNISSNDSDIATLNATKANLDSKGQLKIVPITFAFAASQSGSDVTGLIFDSAEYESGTVTYTIKTATKFERGSFDIIFKGAAWSIHPGRVAGDDSLVTFSGIDATSGQVEYDSDVETGTMKFTYEAFII